MIAKIPPDSGKILYDGYVQLPQLVRGPNTRQSQDMRRPYGAGTEDDLLAIDGKLLMTADDSQSYRSMAFEDDPEDKAVGSDGQTISMARRGRGSPWPHSHARGR